MNIPKSIADSAHQEWLLFVSEETENSICQESCECDFNGAQLRDLEDDKSLRTRDKVRIALP